MCYDPLKFILCFSGLFPFTSKETKHDVYTGGSGLPPLLLLLMSLLLLLLLLLLMSLLLGWLAL